MSKYFDMLAYLMGKQAGGGGGDITVVSKSISTNGTYTAPSGKAYSPVTVDVPNSYAAGDEGKVVSNGELVAQSSDSVTQNGTVDTTLINSLTVNVSGGGGGEDIVDKSITSFSSNTVESIGEYAFYNCASLVSVSTPNLRFSGTTNNVGNDAFRGCSGLKTFDAPYEINCGSEVFYGCSSLEGAFVFSPVGMYTSLFQGCAKLTAIDALLRDPTSSIRASVFSGCALLEVLVLRATTLTPLAHINAFGNSPFASGKSGGTLYVPEALISSYQSASNWSTILGYANNQIKSIESTHTDPNAPIDLTLYYADGTPIST